MCYNNFTCQVWVYLKSNILIVYAIQQRLKPFSIPLLSFLSNGLQDSLVTAKKKKNNNVTKENKMRIFVK